MPLSAGIGICAGVRQGSISTKADIGGFAAAAGGIGFYAGAIAAIAADSPPQMLQGLSRDACMTAIRHPHRTDAVLSIWQDCRYY